MHEEKTDILLVDDNPNDVELTLHALKKNGFDGAVQIVRDGAEALDFIFSKGRFAGRPAGSGPRLILLDLKLPKVSGLEVLKRVKSDEAMRQIPVVALTTSRERRDVDESYRLGVNSYIAKPVDFTEFSEVMRMIAQYWFAFNELPGP
ncbi:MAG: response regulator [Acidobacteriota bacterium]